MPFNKDSVVATVVTRNRLELLTKVIGGLRSQTRKLNAIIIVNNDSSDGTTEWLAQQSDLIVFNQPNIGGAGGHSKAAIEAVNSGYEWIWQMDDDVVPADDCLENLVKFAQPNFVPAPLRIANDGNIFYQHDITKINLSNPFHSIWQQCFEVKDMLDDPQIIPIQGVTLEGPLFHRSIFETAGFVDASFFIYADDTEYSIRIAKHGVIIGIIPSAKLQRLLPVAADEHIFDWKTYYIIHNLITIDRRHGKFLVKYLRPFGYAIKWIMRCKNINDIRVVFRAFFRK